jgi:hypothetical protein
MKKRHRLVAVIGATLAGLALALPSLIATEDMVIEVRTTPEATIIAVTDVHRQGDQVTPLGPTRVYTERRP